MPRAAMNAIPLPPGLLLAQQPHLRKPPSKGILGCTPGHWPLRLTATKTHDCPFEARPDHMACRLLGRRLEKKGVCCCCCFDLPAASNGLNRRLERKKFYLNATPIETRSFDDQLAGLSLGMTTSEPSRGNGHIENDLEGAQETEAICCWKHDCDATVVQISRGPIEECHLCRNTRAAPLVRVLRIAKPFKQANRVRCDLVLAAARGSFQDDSFSNSSGLHIGICDHEGRVLEFDRTGLRFDDKDRSRVWQQCVPLRIITHISEHHKDRTIEGSGLESSWAATVDQFKSCQGAVYHTDEHNCLDFVLEFLAKFLDNARTDGHLSQATVCDIRGRLGDKVMFCQNFVVRQTAQVAKYLVLNRKLEAGDTCIRNRFHAQAINKV